MAKEDGLKHGPAANRAAWKAKHKAFYDTIVDATECVHKGKAVRTMQLNAERMLTIKEGPRPEGAIVRHLCRSDSNSGSPCCNPNHVTWGTLKENAQDTIADGTASHRREEHPCNNTHTCPHCGKVGYGMVMMRWHFDNCRSLNQL